MGNRTSNIREYIENIVRLDEFMTSQYDKLDKETIETLVEDIKMNCQKIEFAVELSNGYLVQ